MTPLPLAALASRRFAAVLFDLDGTLIDSTGAVLRSWSQWASEQGLLRRPEIPHGVPARQVLADLVAEDEIESAFRRIEQIEIDDVAGIVALPGAGAALRAVGDRAAIVTSGTAPLAAARMAISGVVPPSVLVTADDVRKGKPNPEPYLLAAQLLGVAPADCLVVEDAPAGLSAGRAAGCATLALATTHLAGQLNADAVVDSLADVHFDRDGSGGPVRLTAAG